ncbi:MAG: PLDc N-terminal domain-containing protein [Geminicoccaceae bacterium]
MVIIIAISVHVIMKRPATGVALAWLLLVAALPFVGAFIYLLIGERRIGRQRAANCWIAIGFRKDRRPYILSGYHRCRLVEAQPGFPGDGPAGAKSAHQRFAATVFSCSRAHRKYSKPSSRTSTRQNPVC